MTEYGSNGPHIPESIQDEVDQQPIELDAQYVESGAEVSSPYQSEAQESSTAPEPKSKQKKQKVKKEKKPKNGSQQGASLKAIIITAVIVAVLACGGTFLVCKLLGVGNTITVPSSSQKISISALGEDATLSEAVAAKALPSTVSIDTYVKSSSLGYGYGSSTEEYTQYSLGSGCIISEDGYILTNAHVIESADKIVVHLEEDQVEATVVGTDDTSDLAVLKVKASGLTPFDVGNSDDVVLGEWCMVLGSPFGYEKSVSQGIVSGLYRSSAMTSDSGYTIYANLIQTDASLNPGNSGGALVNAAGELIGIPTLLTSYSGSSSGVGFAIPVNYAMNIAEQLIDKGSVTHAYLGCTLETVTAANASSYNAGDLTYGAYVAGVEKGSPAAEYGIQAGDIIVGFDGQDTKTADELIIQVRSCFVGDKVELKVYRKGSVTTVEVELGAYKAQDITSNKGQGDSNNSPSDIYEYLYEYFYGGGDDDSGMPNFGR